MEGNRFELQFKDKQIYFDIWASDLIELNGLIKIMFNWGAALNIEFWVDVLQTEHLYVKYRVIIKSEDFETMQKKKTDFLRVDIYNGSTFKDVAWAESSL